MHFQVRKTQLFIIICILYTAIQFALLYFVKSSAVFCIGVIPIILISRFQGYRAVIAMGVVMVAIQPICFNWALKPITPKDFLAGSAATVVMTIIGVLYGQMVTLTRTVQVQLDKMRAAEKEKIELQEQLFQSQKMEAIGQLSGGIAHDFNNMLAAISGYAELIKIRFACDNETLEKYASGIYNAAQNAAEITSKLLAFSRKGTFETQPVDYRDLIKNVTEILIHTVDKRIVFELQFGADDSMVLGDAAQLQNSLLNLAINAKDSMPDGGVITVSTQLIDLDEGFINAHCFGVKEGVYVRISIQDTGTGIDRAILPRVFEPFFTTKAQGKGTGLGLSMVYGTVKAHGGHVEIDSTVGVGTKVSMYLPAIYKSNCDSEHCDKVTQGGGFVLMIDDEKMVSDVTSEMIRGLGYTIQLCEDGIEGIAYYREHFQEIDFIILDLMMPRISGYDCFKELKKINPSIKVIIVSGYSGKEDIGKMVEYGNTVYLQKPFTRKSLSDAITSVMHDVKMNC